LAAKARLYQIVDLGPGAFQDAKNETMLLFFENSAPDGASKTEVIRTTPKSFCQRTQTFVALQRTWASRDGQAWRVRASSGDIVILDRMKKQPKKLGDFCTANQGLRTGDNERFLSDTKRGKTWEPAAGGKEVRRYGPIPKGLFVRYAPTLLDAPRRPEIFAVEAKIVVQEIRNISLDRRIVATLDTAQTFCLQSTNVVNLKPGVGLDITYLLGVLNSTAVNRFFRCRFPGNNHIPSNQLLRIPIPVPPSKQTHDRVATLVKAMLDLNKELATAKSEARKPVIQRQIDATDAEIDRLVYDLYGFTAEEIAIVQETTK
jgi:hypothetical protein